MKRKIGKVCAVALAALQLSMPLSVSAAESISVSNLDINALLGDAGDKLSDALKEMDESEVKEIFGFVEEKLQDGSLKTEDGLDHALKEGEDKFGVKIDKQDAQKVVDTMEQLENIGFSGEYVVERAEKLYDEYGADFVDHADEVVKDAVGNAIQNTTKSFFKGLWASAKSFVKSIISGI